MYTNDETYTVILLKYKTIRISVLFYFKGLMRDVSTFSMEIFFLIFFFSGGGGDRFSVRSPIGRLCVIYPLSSIMVSWCHQFPIMIHHNNVRRHSVWLYMRQCGISLPFQIYTRKGIPMLQMTTYCNNLIISKSLKLIRAIRLVDYSWICSDIRN